MIRGAWDDKYQLSSFFSSRSPHTRCALVTEFRRVLCRSADAAPAPVGGHRQPGDEPADRCRVEVCRAPDTRVFAQEPPEHAQREPVRGAGRGAGCYIMIAESPGDGGADIVRHSEQRRAEALDDLAPFVAELDFGDLRRMVRRCRIE